jgi:hypothetical protein
MCQILAITDELLGYGNKKDKPCGTALPLLKNDITTITRSQKPKHISLFYRFK